MVEFPQNIEKELMNRMLSRDLYYYLSALMGPIIHLIYENNSSCGFYVVKYVFVYRLKYEKKLSKRNK